jgi:thioesterase domain-containing protein
MRAIEKVNNPTATRESPASYSAAIQARREQITRSWMSRMRSGSLIELRRGGPRNLFLVHDGVGATLLYLNLARRMPDDIGVYAIEPRRMPRIPLAHTTIEDMAAFYIEEIRKRQPHGPYLLGGLCAGGVIAYEMALQLTSAGESVGLLALLETAAPHTPERLGRMARQRLGRLKQTFASVREGDFELRRIVVMLGAIVRKSINGLRWEIQDRAEQLSVRLRFRLLRKVLRRKSAWPATVRELTVQQIYDCAHSRYAPKPMSSSNVLLVRAQTGEGEDEPFRNVYAEGTFGWHAIVDHLTAVDVAGGHSTMLNEGFVDSLAKALTPHLEPKAAALSEPLDSCRR